MLREAHVRAKLDIARLLIRKEAIKMADCLTFASLLTDQLNKGLLATNKLNFVTFFL